MHSSDPHQRPYTIFGTRNRQTSFGATDFLRANDRMAALLPAAMRMGRLQQDVAAALPSVAAACAVLSCEGGVLVLAVPNAAVATRLKQQIQGLTAKLQTRGWDVQSIRLKVQVVQPPAPDYVPRQLSLPPNAVDAFEDLGKSLDRTPANAPLIAALERLAARRR
ncbi:DUF721 domain-containing protein [Massilia arenosa]|uniref:DUF721 domain-containing protein n=1 Tax=Zemynaea arenosa TaxID=2561931 RepID=A0A4Y9S9N8_9BURK|nr:DciA family protein [Massilia arenosa]TFW18453.1 DUF721 domain-containing protein [Massilia arenosa]